MKYGDDIKQSNVHSVLIYSYNSELKINRIK